METLGSLVDKLQIVNLKMWNAQEKLYEVRRMSFEEFKLKYGTEEGLKEIFDIFKKSCDLNIQRNHYIDDIDFFIVELIEKINNIKETTEIDSSKYIAKKHKTY